MAKQGETAKAAASVKVVVDIKPGQATLAQSRSWRNFWHRLIAEVNAAEKEESSPQASADDAPNGGDGGCKDGNERNLPNQ